MSLYPARSPSLPMPRDHANRHAIRPGTEHRDTYLDPCLYPADELACGDDTGDGSVMDRALRNAAESRRWAILARALRRAALATGAPLGRGYRLAVSRAGVYARRAMSPE